MIPLPLPVAGFIGAVIAALLAFGTFQTWRIDRLHNDLRQADARTATAVQRAIDIADARKKDAEQAKTTYEDQQQFCTTGMRTAIGQGRIIERITQAPAPAGGGRGLIGADSLRLVLGGAAQAPGHP